MKKLLSTLILPVLILAVSQAQHYYEPTGFPGDDFSLEGAIEMFKHSNDLEEFEYRLNQRDNFVNNLDLDLDGRIDYVRVEAKRSGNFHAIILQVPVTRYEAQDIAVLEIEKTGRRRAILQIIGDEYIYGQQVIAEPFETYANSWGNGPNPDFDFRYNTVNVWYWPAVQHLYGRYYRPWSSPYSYNYCPSWYTSYDVYDWNYYSQRRANYYNYYRITPIFRVRRANRLYNPYRSYSYQVRNRCEFVRNNPNTTYRTGSVSRKRSEPTYTGPVNSSRYNSKFEGSNDPRNRNRNRDIKDQQARRNNGNASRTEIITDDFRTKPVTKPKPKPTPRTKKSEYKRPQASSKYSGKPYKPKTQTKSRTDVKKSQARSRSNSGYSSGSASRSSSAKRSYSPSRSSDVKRSSSSTRSSSAKRSYSPNKSSSVKRSSSPNRSSGVKRSSSPSRSSSVKRSSSPSRSSSVKRSSSPSRSSSVKRSSSNRSSSSKSSGSKSRRQ